MASNPPRPFLSTGARAENREERERERDEIRDARNEGQFSITGRGEIASLATANYR